MPEFLHKEFCTQETAYNTLSRYRNVAGKNVLEIGGHSNCASVMPFIRNGAAKVDGKKTFNPMPDRGHLIYSREQLTEMLKEYGAFEEDIEKILLYIFKDDELCRESTASLVKAMNESDLEIVELEYDRVEMSHDTRDLLRRTCGPHEDYSILGLRAVLRKIR